PVAISVTANDYDPQGGEIRIDSFSVASHGTTWMDPDLGNDIQYTPDTGYEGADSFTYTISSSLGGTSTAAVSITVGTGSGTNHFTHTISDGRGGTSSATVSITINPSPISASGVAVSAAEGMAFSGKPVATFTDPGGSGSASDYTATIDWGDGTAPTAGAIS